MTDDLLKELRQLRERAGNPSLSDLARLIQKQGPGRRMSRATIGYKLSGKTTVKLPQVMALVQAFADYAESAGIPLPAESVSNRTWIDRATAAKLHTTQPGEAGDRVSGTSSTLSKSIESKEELERLLTPLLAAGMRDVVQLIKENFDKPLASWLPATLVALDMARMDDRRFIELTALMTPDEAVEMLLALIGESEGLSERLLLLYVNALPPEEIPEFIVLLRRAGDGEGLVYVDATLAAILGKGERYSIEPRDDINDVVGYLRAATLYKDADRLLIEAKKLKVE